MITSVYTITFEKSVWTCFGGYSNNAHRKCGHPAHTLLEILTFLLGGGGGDTYVFYSDTFTACLWII